MREKSSKLGNRSSRLAFLNHGAAVVIAAVVAILSTIDFGQKSSEVFAEQLRETSMLIFR